MTEVRYNAERRGTNRVVCIPHCKEVAVHLLFHLYINGGYHFTRPTMLQHCARREWPGVHCALTSIPLCNHLLCLHLSDPVILILVQLLSFPFSQQLTFDSQPYNRNTKISINQRNCHIIDLILSPATNMSSPPGIHTEPPSDLQYVQEFIRACEPVLDLPFGTGEEKWDMFRKVYGTLQARDIDVLEYISVHTHAHLFRSPLFEILFGPTPTASSHPPTPTTFSMAPETPGTVLTPARGTVSFSPKRFINLCHEINTEVNVNGGFTKTDLFWTLHGMIAALHLERINVLDFLSSEDTDDLLNGCAFFRLVTRVLTGFASHVIVDWDAFENAIVVLGQRQGQAHHGRRLLMPPYPPNDCGLSFCQDDLLQAMIDAEADKDQVIMDDLDAIESIDVLHNLIHDLETEDVMFSDFMAGYELQEGEPGALMFDYILRSLYPGTSQFNCILFNAHVTTNGNGDMTWLEDDDDDLPSVLAQEQAVAFVDTLQQADVANIPRDSMRCPTCWSDFDEVEEGVDNLPVHLPCDSRHMLGRDCLIAILTGTGTLCPICRVDIVALGPQAPGTSP
jgi:hypothetical protein